MVTGASRGIGRAIAVRLAADGALVAVHYGRHAEEAEQTARMIEQAGGQAFVIGADLAQPEVIEPMFTKLDAELSRRNCSVIDVLVNNAGIGGGGGIEGMEQAKFDKLFATNVRGTFLVTKHALKRFSDGGRVINISSMVSLAAYPGSIAYAMTKAAVNSFTVSLAVELGKRGITVNAVAPGATQTDFIATYLADPKNASFLADAAALGRIGQPTDIADVVALLAAAEGRWVTGQIIQASGGMHL